MGKMKNFGIVIGSIALVALVVILILSFAMPAGYWMGAKDAKEFDDWAKSAKQGDSITISGKIDEKDSESLLGVSIYTYRMKDCEASFLSSEDLGDEGDKVTVEVEIRELGPEAAAQPSSILVNGPHLCCGILAGLLIILGLVLFLIGLRKKKEPETDTSEDVKDVQQDQQTEPPKPVNPYLQQALQRQQNMHLQGNQPPPPHP